MTCVDLSHAIAVGSDPCQHWSKPGPAWAKPAQLWPGRANCAQPFSKCCRISWNRAANRSKRTCIRRSAEPPTCLVETCPRCRNNSELASAGPKIVRTRSQSERPRARRSPIPVFACPAACAVRGLAPGCGARTRLVHHQVGVETRDDGCSRHEDRAAWGDALFGASGSLQGVGVAVEVLRIVDSQVCQRAIGKAAGQARPRNSERMDQKGIKRLRNNVLSFVVSSIRPE